MFDTVPEEPRTPFLRADPAKVHRNLQRAADLAAAAGVTLRPHAKTHKSRQVAELQLGAGAVGLTVATIGEAEAFAAYGCSDLFIAYPLWLDDASARRLGDLAETTRLAIGVDSVAGAANAGRHLGGRGIEALVEIDSGQHRSGAEPDEAGDVAVAALHAGLPVRGVFTFPGHGYGEDPVGVALEEATALRAAVASMGAAGVEARVVSGGSTPTLAHTDLDVVTELRPGVYAFNDAQQWELGVVGPEDIALTCVATVVSHAGGRLVLDAGSKALGADRAPYASGWGRLPGAPDARVVLLSEHHAVVDLAGAPLPPLGSRVEIAPNHVCAAVNLHDLIWSADQAGPQQWSVTARGRNG
ncbi:alanine racemase [Nocardioides sp. zg-DK7169]|uniref:alanine racemase n=1 Tax=Nocardioides sp. zg-DK7169 TaxID=2736600 RepID=UPI00155465BF|nr:alanine racemase [Nocardioides sp. zg-DK7169]NPC96438.1 D-TA family PLP-dependent enzyme [Nocardioides sp. zg-DK7169]